MIRVKSHEFFERDGDDILCEMPITYAQAALGDEVEVPTVLAKSSLKYQVEHKQAPISA